MANCTSERSRAAEGAGDCGAAGAGPASTSDPATARAARMSRMYVFRITTLDKPRLEYSTRSREVARARQGLQLGDGRLRGKAAQVGSGPEQDPIGGRQAFGRAQDGGDRLGALDPFRPSVGQPQPQHESPRERRVPQQVEARPAPHAVQAQAAETLQARDAGVEPADVATLEMQAEGE